MTRHARPAGHVAPTRAPSRRTRATGATLAGLCLVLGACSGEATASDPTTTPGRTAAPAPEADGQEDVATLQDDDDASSPAAVDPLVERYGEPVRLRLDFTEEEETAAYARFDECVAGESGIGPDDLAAPAGGDRGSQDVAPGEPAAEDGAKLDQAHEDCLVVAPLPPWEYDPQNPDAVDFVQAVVDCLRAAGVQHVEVTQDAGRVGVSLGGADNHGPSVSLGMEHYDRCEREVAASGAGG